MKNQKGFSLVELLVVVIIIAIIAAIAIPNLLASRRAGNEASAISSMRTIHSAEVTYYSTYGGNATYAALGVLDDTGVDLIDTTLGAAITATTAKSGYVFDANTGANVYCASAIPAVQTGVTRTGDRRFAVTTPGVIFASVAGTNPGCAAGVLTTGTNSAPIN